ncbi:DUF1351 domain-containing protein [Mammaliicoccus sciuri]|uniref:DUF1351 domain-containing protein n=1 Tax=Mammaliicoccus sciuri TaxID=1296 RepID=UPI0034DD6F01
MTTELSNMTNFSIVLKKSSEVKFIGYEELKASAIKLAENVKSVQVTEENIQTSKKLLAAINKETKKINDSRIKLKKELLKPYTDVETKVKEIDSIVSEANDIVKKQISELEQIERDKKSVEIENLFNKRIRHYKFSNVFNFKDFIKPSYLNKSMSLNKVEDILIEWLEKIKNDFKVIESHQHSDEILIEYIELKDLASAINKVEDRHKEKKVRQQQLNTRKELSKKVSFEIDEKDLRFVEMLLNHNGIEFKKL